MWSADQLRSGLLTDLYHVDSAYVSWRSGRNGLTTFDLYSRSNPFGSGYMLAAGLELAVTFAREFRYGEEEIAYLKRVKPYEDAFYDELRRLRFTGEILGMPEGEIAFAPEPLLRVTAPFREALLLEAGLLHVISLSTLIATKAARIVQSARGKGVAEFGFRRAQEPYIAARSGYIAGCASTSFLAAACAFGIPTSGTIPHALIQSFPTEEEAFRTVAESLPRYTLLLDTYDVRQAIQTAVEVGREAREKYGHRLAGVRLDSGDILADSHPLPAGAGRSRNDRGSDRRQRRHGRVPYRRAGSSRSADRRLRGRDRAGGGAGSVEHGISGGALGGVYKLVWYDADADSTADPTEAPIKVAGPKSTWPGKKQVSRIGVFREDVIHLEDEAPLPDGRSLLEPVLRGGELIPGVLPSLNEIRDRAARNLAALPPEYRAIENPAEYPVRTSDRLREMRERAMQQHGNGVES